MCCTVFVDSLATCDRCLTDVIQLRQICYEVLTFYGRVNEV